MTELYIRKPQLVAAKMIRQSDYDELWPGHQHSREPADYIKGYLVTERREFGGDELSFHFIDRKEFEKQYTPKDGLSFSEAVALMYTNKSVKRKDWQPGQNLTIYIPNNHRENPYFKYTDENGMVGPWQIMTTDVIASDWELCGK